MRSASRAKACGQDFERHLAVQVRVAGAIHLAHAARAERGDNFIRPESGSGLQGHGFPLPAGASTSPVKFNSTPSNWALSGPAPQDYLVVPAVAFSTTVNGSTWSGLT